MAKYSLVLHGAKSSDPESVSALKAAIGSRFKLSDKAVDSLFKRLPVVLKRELEERQVTAFKKVFEQMGAIVEAIQEETPKPSATSFALEEAGSKLTEISLPSEHPASPPLTENKNSSDLGLTGSAREDEPSPRAVAQVPPAQALQPAHFAPSPSTERMEGLAEEDSAESEFTADQNPRTPNVKRYAVIGGTLLFGALVVFLFWPAAPDEISKPATVKKLLGDQKKIFGDRKKKKTESVVAPIEFSGTSEHNNVTSEITAIAQGEKILSFSIKGRSTPSQPLTPEEIVAHVKRQPWLSRIELTLEGKELSQELDSSNGLVTFSVSQLARVYLEDDEGSGRSAATFTLHGSFHPEERILSVSWTAADTSQITPESSEPFSERVDSDQFRFVFQGTSEVYPSDFGFPEKQKTVE